MSQVPTWGLKRKQRERRPWGLDPGLLAPGKVTTDPVHGDVHTSVLEQMIIDSGAFQRLRRVRQLGTTHLVYPGAVHTRFSHSLGALRVVQDLLDGVIGHREGLHPVKLDWFGQRFDAAGVQPEKLDAVKKEVAEAIVLARLGALLHDLGHVPFGHSVEDDLRFLVPHDENWPRFRTSWAEIEADVRASTRSRIGTGAAQSLDTLFLRPTSGDLGRSLLRQLEPLVISKGPDVLPRTAQRFPWVGDLVGDTICADLLDYLLRDHLFTGLPASLGTRFITAFFVVPLGRGPYSERAALSIARDGHERADIVSELLKALRYRYELSERALTHHAKLAADAMVGKTLELWENCIWLDVAGTIVDELDEAESLLESGDVPAIRAAVVASLGSTEPPPSEDPDARQQSPEPTAYDDARATVQAVLERQIAIHGDDGLLEMLATFAPSQPAQPNARPPESSAPSVSTDPGEASAPPSRAAARGEVASAPEDLQPGAGARATLIATLRRHSGELADDLLSRRLFKQIGRVGLADAAAKGLYNAYGSASRRIALQDETQRWLGLDARPQVLLWLPDTKMRLKLAEVLVDDGEHIDLFVDYERARTGRGSEIYDAHARLWACYVFVPRSFAVEHRRLTLAFLARRLGVCWEAERRNLGPAAGEWVDRLILSDLAAVAPLDPSITRLMRESRGRLAARSALDTYAAERAALKLIYEDSLGARPTTTT